MIGILAYGSLITDPGFEIEPLINDRIKTKTPFNVEYARYSSKRGGAPTLVPVETGGKVNCEILVMEIDSLQKAKNLLYRREIGKIGSEEKYVEPKNPGPNKVLVKELEKFEGMRGVVYTDFPDEGKITSPVAQELSEAAINSVEVVDKNEDGISYLKDAKNSGVITPLTESYMGKILEKTGSQSLSKALEKLRK